MQFADMHVYGYRVTAEVQEKAFRRFVALLTSPDPDEHSTMEGCLNHFGVPWAGQGVAYRAADRLLQRARKANLIRHNRTVWEPTEKAIQKFGPPYPHEA